MSTTLNADMGEALGIHTFGNDTCVAGSRRYIKDLTC